MTKNKRSGCSIHEKVWCGCGRRQARALRKVGLMTSKCSGNKREDAHHLKQIELDITAHHVFLTSQSETFEFY